MPRGQKQQSMEKIVRPRWSLGGSATKLSSLSLSVEVTSLCKTHVGLLRPGPGSLVARTWGHRECHLPRVGV